MANGHGGNRTGSGRKPKSAAARVLDGGAGHRAKVVPHPSVPPQVDPAAPPWPAIDPAEAPDDLSSDERAIWLELAPQARANGTLASSTAVDFSRLCRRAALERDYDRSVQERGGANHRGVMQAVDRLMLRFGLSPCGKRVEPEAAAVPAVDPVKARYFGRR